MNQRIILHVDFDYFYAQCEEIRKPDLKAKPVVVCMFSDRGGDSGAVATANYTAREFGVKSGLSIQFAKQKLKDRDDTAFLPADFEYYSEMSDKKSEWNFTKAGHIGQQIKNEIREKTKLTCSVGISPNKLLSKIASDYKKPDGLTTITPDDVSEFMKKLGIRDIPGIGIKTEQKLAEENIQTIDEIRNLDVFTLINMFGRKAGTYIHNAIRGIDDEPVTIRAPTLQLSKITTLKEDSIDYTFLERNMLELCEKLHSAVLKENKMFRSVGIHLIQNDLSTKTRSRMLRNPTQNLDEIKKVSAQLLKEALQEQTIEIRRIGIKVSELSDLEGQSNITNYF